MRSRSNAKKEKELALQRKNEWKSGFPTLSLDYVELLYEVADRGAQWDKRSGLATLVLLEIAAQQVEQSMRAMGAQEEKFNDGLAEAATRKKNELQKNLESLKRSLRLADGESEVTASMLITLKQTHEYVEKIATAALELIFKEMSNDLAEAIRLSRETSMLLDLLVRKLELLLVATRGKPDEPAINHLRNLLLQAKALKETLDEGFPEKESALRRLGEIMVSCDKIMQSVQKHISLQTCINRITEQMKKDGLNEKEFNSKHVREAMEVLWQATERTCAAIIATGPMAENTASLFRELESITSEKVEQMSWIGEQAAMSAAKLGPITPSRGMDGGVGGPVVRGAGAHLGGPPLNGQFGAPGANGMHAGGGMMPGGMMPGGMMPGGMMSGGMMSGGMGMPPGPGMVPGGLDLNGMGGFQDSGEDLDDFSRFEREVVVNSEYFSGFVGLRSSTHW